MNKSNKIAMSDVVPSGDLNKNEDPESKQSKPSLLISWRFLCITLMLFLGGSAAYIQRIDMGLAIVCMVNNTALKSSNVDQSVITETTQSPNLLDIPSAPENLFYAASEDTSKCKFQPSNTTASSIDGRFVWNKNIQGWIGSSYFYGYILTQMPSGWLSFRFGGKIIFAASMLIGSVMTILAAPIAYLGYPWLIICRIITGIAHGLVFPAISSIFVQWAPPLEKSRMIGLVAAGANLGNVFALAIGGFLCEKGFAEGWGSIFYIFGIIGLVWLALFWILVSDSPATHRFISEREKNYIMSELKGSGSSNAQKIRSMPTPWKSIFTSKACYATFIVHFSVNWGNYLFLTNLPSYMKEVLKFDIKSNGIFSSLPYLAAFAMVVISGQISDFLVGSKKLSKTFTRKLFISMGLFVPAISVIILIFITCSQPYVGVALLIIGIGFFGCATGAGYQVNINEIGGPFASVVYGVSNTFSTIPGIVAPYIVGVITKNQLQSEWRIVFIISAVIFICGGIFYLFFGTTNQEKWTEIDE